RALQHERVGLVARQLSDQARLADAGVAAEHHDAPGPLPRAVERRAEPCELRAPADEGSTGRHVRSLGTAPPPMCEVRHTYREIRQSHRWRGAAADVRSPP